jgi:hypothetical protein
MVLWYGRADAPAPAVPIAPSAGKPTTVTITVQPPSVSNRGYLSRQWPRSRNRPASKKVERAHPGRTFTLLMKIDRLVYRLTRCLVKSTATLVS